MTKLDNYKKEFLKILTDIGDEKDMGEFLTDMLTKTELDELSKRLQIIKLPSKGILRRKVAEDLGVGVATVTRGAKELKNKKSGLKKILAKIYE